MSGAETTPKTAKERIAELEAEREKRREAYAEARDEQLVKDLEQLALLESPEDYARILRINLRGWKPGVGAATMVVARVPARGESLFKRFEQSVAKAKTGTTQTLDASQTLALACIVYPSKKDHPEMYAATMELASGVESHLALQLIEAMQGAAEEEKKD